MKIRIYALILLSIFFILTLSTALRTSGTCDEIAHHIPVGYVLLTKWDLKMDTSQPPLSRYIIALPLKLFMHINIPEDKNEWRRPDRASFGRDFFYKYNTDPKKIIFLCRIPVMIIGIMCGLLLFMWTSSLYGKKAGLLALFLYCFSPTVLAHASLATTDIIATFFIFLSVYSFWLFLSNRSLKNVFFAGLCLGLAQLSKYNAVLLYPIFLLLVSLEFPAMRRSKMFSLFMKFIVIVFVSLIVTWAGYGFDFQPILKDAMRVEEKIGIAHKVVPSFAGKGLEYALLHMPTPLGTHILGVLGVLRHNYEGHGSFFLGKRSAGGNILYFPVAFLIKNPIPMLILLITGFFIMVKKRIGRAERVILISVALYFAVSSLGKLQIGIRHILPLYPLCFMIAGRSEELLNRKYWNPVIISLIVWNVFSTLYIMPNYIGYFNETIGGSRNGYKYLRESNLDWGQDLPSLSKYMNENNISEIVLECFGESDPATYGIRFRRFSPDELISPKNNVYAVSAQYLEHVKWTKDREPTAIAGSSIFIYDLTKRNSK